jgi:hypothetical protein
MLRYQAASFTLSLELPQRGDEGVAFLAQSPDLGLLLLKPLLKKLRANLGLSYLFGQSAQGH